MCVSVSKVLECGSCFTNPLWVILVDRSFFFITIYMKTEFVNIGSWLRMSMNRLSIFLLNSLKIFIRLCTYLLKGTSSKINKNKQENKLAGQCNSYVPGRKDEGKDVP